MKKRTKAGQVPVSKLQKYFGELSKLLTEGGNETFYVKKEGSKTSIYLGDGQYLNVSVRKGEVF